MQIQLNQGVYQIRPSASNRPMPIARSSTTSTAKPTAPAVVNAPTASPPSAAPTSAESITAARGPDRVELTSLNFQSAQSALPNVDKYHAKMQNLVAAKVNQPISFDTPSAPPGPSSANSRPMNIYDRAYFRHTANHAALNAAAVERETRTVDTNG